MGNSNAAKTAQLGVSFSTATHQLRKSVMFDMMQRLGEDECFKCGNKIENVAELSMEHKVPWLFNDTSLFWDLDNLAWSHLRCNKTDRPHSPYGQTWSLKTVPGGESWCRKGHSAPLSEFSSNVTRYRKVEHTCKMHRSEYRSTIRL